MTKLGCGEYHAFLQERGGGATLIEIPISQLSLTKRLDDHGQADISLPVTGLYFAACCELINLAEPWRHEVIIYRDRQVAFVGPLVSLTVNRDSATLTAHDLFFWTERRFIAEDMFFSDDASLVFEEVFDAAMAPDTSPNIQLIAHNSGVEVERTVSGKEFIRAADLLRELCRTAVDFVTINRQVIVGGKEVFEPGVGPGIPLILHDDGILTAEISKDGAQFATDVAVFGEAVFVGSDDRITGRATRASEYYGLVQTSFAELTIKDTPSANENALSRLLQMQPVPVRASVTFSPDAAFDYQDLICGRRVDVRLSDAAGCLPLNDVMRIHETSVGVNVAEEGVTETIGAEIVPLGLSEIEGAA